MLDEDCAEGSWMEDAVAHLLEEGLRQQLRFRNVKGFAGWSVAAELTPVRQPFYLYELYAWAGVTRCLEELNAEDARVSDEMLLLAKAVLTELRE